MDIGKKERSKRNKIESKYYQKYDKIWDKFSATICTACFTNKVDTIYGTSKIFCCSSCSRNKRERDDDDDIDFISNKLIRI